MLRARRDNHSRLPKRPHIACQNLRAIANWDQLHEEACEEMSLIMAQHYLTGTPLPLDGAERELQAMIAWEHTHDYGDDVKIGELGLVAEANFGVHARVLTSVSVEHLKRELMNDEHMLDRIVGTHRRLCNVCCREPGACERGGCPRVT